VVSLPLTAMSFKLAHNGLQLKEVGGFYRNAFEEKIFSIIKILSAEHIAANFF